MYLTKTFVVFLLLLSGVAGYMSGSRTQVACDPGLIVSREVEVQFIEPPPRLRWRGSQYVDYSKELVPFEHVIDEGNIILISIPNPFVAGHKTPIFAGTPIEVGNWIAERVEGLLPKKE